MMNFWRRKINELSAEVYHLLIMTIRCADKKPPSPSVIVVWHDYILLFFKFFRKSQALVIVSAREDGYIAANFALKNKIAVVLASGEKSVSGMREVLRVASNYRYIIITADGPQGPRHKIKFGALWLAHKLNWKVCGCVFKHQGWRLNSWDKLAIPYPFSKFTASFTPAKKITAKSQFASVKNELESEMERLDSLQS